MKKHYRVRENSFLWFVRDTAVKTAQAIIMATWLVLIAKVFIY